MESIIASNEFENFSVELQIFIHFFIHSHFLMINGRNSFNVHNSTQFCLRIRPFFLILHSHTLVLDLSLLYC